MLHQRIGKLLRVIHLGMGLARAFLFRISLSEPIWPFRQLFRTEVHEVTLFGAELRCLFPMPLQERVGGACQMVIPDCRKRHEMFPHLEDYCVFGSHLVSLGPGEDSRGIPIAWHHDFIHDHAFNPRRFYAFIRPAPYPGGYDIKVPWELSRGHHLVWLGQAYCLTGDEAYPQKFRAQVLDWIEANRHPFGVNWASTMDSAIRVVNWLWGYALLCDSPALDDEFKLAFYKSLLVHGRHIRTNLEWSEQATTNHYLSNLVALLYLGILVPEFKPASAWMTFALEELEKEMFRQVYPDGMDYEASTSYHRLVAEMLLVSVILAEKSGHAFSKAFMDRLEGMLEFTLHLTKPDGRVPLIGDNDNGRLLRLRQWEPPEREWQDHRYLLAIGAVLFDREDFASAAGDQWAEALWLLGERTVTAREQLPDHAALSATPSSRAFPDAGLYIMRDEDLYVAVDAGKNGQGGYGGHAHNDVFSFELQAAGQDWIVDPGTYTYTADYELRNLFRSTAYHNTLRVDGQEQNRFDPKNLWSMEEDARPRLIRWDCSLARDVLEAEHYGYQRLDAPVLHRRKFVLEKGNRSLAIEDHLRCEGTHQYELNFHCAQGVTARSEGVSYIRLESPGGSHAVLNVSFLEGLGGAPSLSIEEGWLAPGYGERVPATILSLAWTGSGDVHVRTQMEFKDD